MRGPFRGNVGEHVLAFALALVLWFFVKSTLTPVRPPDVMSRSFPRVAVELRNRPQDMETRSISTGTVTLTLRGAPELMESLAAGDVLAYVDLRSLEEGRHQLSIRVDVPAGIEVSGAVPARWEVELERIISTQTRVTLVPSGTVASGHYAPPGQLDPEIVLVTGPRSSISRLTALFVVVDMEGATDPITGSVTLRPLDQNGDVITGVSISPDQVFFEHPVWPVKEVPLQLEDHIIEQLEELGLTWDITPLSVQVTAPRELLSDFDVLKLPLDPTLIREGEIEFPLTLPDRIMLLAPKSPVVIVLSDVQGREEQDS